LGFQALTRRERLPKSLIRKAGETLIGGGTIISWLKFLDSATPFGLGHMDIAFGIDGQSVAMGKFSDLVTRTPEARENFSAGMVENFDLLVASIGDVNVFLLPAGEKPIHYVVPQLSRKLFPLLIQMLFLKFPILSKT
jgi:hypothetical protein